MSDYTKMGNEEIGEFCLKAGRKLAKDVYTIAKAIKVVHDRIGGKKGDFKAWREKYIPFISKATAYRYLAVAEIDPAQIGETEGITELYKRFFILPATPPVEPTEPSGKSGTGTTTAVSEVAPASNAEGATKANDAPPPAVTEVAPASNAVEAAKVNDAPSPTEEIGQTVPENDPTDEEDMQGQDEDMTQEEEEDLRAAELTVAQIVTEKLAAKHGISGDLKNLVAFLGEFGVTLGDINALDRALAAA